MRREAESASAVGRVLLCGPDGVGKSTIGQALTDHLASPVRLHYRTGPIFRAAEGKAVSQPHGARPRGTVLSLAKLLLVLIDHGLTLWGLRVRGKCVVAERGWPDQEVDPLRYRLSASVVPIVGLAGRLLPKWDLAVVLTASPELIRSRKEELPREEILRQLRRWERVAPRYAQSIVMIDASASVDQICQLILGELAANESGRPYRLLPRRLRAEVSSPGALCLLDGVYRPTGRVAKLAQATRLRLLFVGRQRTSALLTTVHQVISQAMPGIGLDDVAAVCNRQTGRVVAAAVSIDGDRFFVKMGGHHEAILREAETLECLSRASEPAPFAAPELLSTGLYRSLPYLLTRMEGDLKTTRLTADFFEAYVRWMRRTGLGRHGDLTRWNSFDLPDGRRLLVDWEDATRGADATLDLIHYAVQDAALSGGASANALAEALLDPGGLLVRLCGGVAEARGALATYLESSARFDSHVERMFRRQLKSRAFSSPAGERL